MSNKSFADRQHKIACSLSRLPRRMLSLRDQDNVTEFVLHSLADDECFGFDRVAYFVDNPDFDWLKGVAGVDRSEAYCGQDVDIWHNAATFSEHMKKAVFNQKVRALSAASFRRKGADDTQIAQELAHNLHMNQYQFFTWDMKHDNHGILLFERKSNDIDTEKELLEDGACLLSFCPVF